MSRVCGTAAATLCALLTVSVAHAANHVVTIPPGTQTFRPQNLTIRVGDTVTFQNPANGGMSHNVVADDNSFTSGSASAGPWSFSQTFTFTGTISYYCAPHGGPGGSGHSGTITVIDAIEISHGTDLFDDLGGAPDRYRISQKPFSSYEIVVEPAAGNPALQLDRTDAAGAVIQTGEAVSATIDMTQSLRWVNSAASATDTQRIRISASNCTTVAVSCSSNEVYRVRAYETTYAIPRFNQSGTQVSIVILQNPNNYSISGLVYFWNSSGTLLNAGGHPFTLAARSALVLNAGTVAGVNGTSGTVTVVHDGRYGDLAGKVVALEPATGFSFDTMGVNKPK
jgi:plastocyanin